MDLDYTYEKLDNGMELFNIKDPAKITSMFVVLIKRGTKDDPFAYGGTYHYMEHLLGSYFDYSKYGSNYDHLSAMNGTTLPTYLHIYKNFLFDARTLDTLVDNFSLFVTCKEFNANILENEKWMVNNETTSKLYDYPMMNIFFIYEQIQTGRLSSTFGRLSTLNEQVLIDTKHELEGIDYSVFFINVPDSSYTRQSKILSRIKFGGHAKKNTKVRRRRNKSTSRRRTSRSTRDDGVPVESSYDEALRRPPDYVNRLRGKHVLLIDSMYNLTCMIFTNVEPAVLLYMQCTGNDIYEFTWKARPYVFQTYNDSLIVYTNEINSIEYDDDELVRMFSEAYVQFLMKIYNAPIEESSLFFVYFYANIVTNPMYYNLLKEYNLESNASARAYDMKIYKERKCVDKMSVSDMVGGAGGRSRSTAVLKLLEHMQNFVDEFEPRFPSNVDFVLARLINLPSKCILDSFNQDTKLNYALVPYTKTVKIDLHRLSLTAYSDLLLVVNIDYASGMIYSNTMTYTSRTTYMCIELDMYESIDGVGFVIFYFLSGCMPYYYTTYDDTRMIMNCTYQIERKIIESNLNNLRYSDVYDLATKLKLKQTDILNSRNSLYFLILYYLKNIDMKKLQSKGDKFVFRERNKYRTHLMNYSKLISTEVPVNMLARNVKYKIHKKINIRELKATNDNYFIIYNECDDIILSQIFIQYIHALMQRLSRLRRIYMSNIRSGYDDGYYIIIINAQIKSIQKELLDLYDRLDDKIMDINFDLNVNTVLVNIIRMMLYYNVRRFRSHVDMYSVDLLREFIDLQFQRIRKF